MHEFTTILQPAYILQQYSINQPEHHKQNKKHDFTFCKTYSNFKSVYEGTSSRMI
jgi:hypothetical protein